MLFINIKKANKKKNDTYPIIIKGTLNIKVHKIILNVFFIIIAPNGWLMCC